MNDLKSIISILSSEEQQTFVNYLQHKNKRPDAKNIQLFKLLVTDNHTADTINKKLYNTKSKDAYHALCKRLQQSLIDFIASKNLNTESSENLKVIKFILVARVLLQQQQFKIAFKLLSKAEQLAKELQLYAFLNEVYHTKIQFAHTVSTANLNELIIQFKTNQQQYVLEEELNIVYAKLRHTLHHFSFKSEVFNFEDRLQHILNAHHITISESLSFKSLYQLMSIASISAFITKDYLNIENFVLRTYATIENNTQKEKQPYYHIQVLYMIANTLFRNKKFESSLQFLQLMHREMQQQRRKYYGRFQLKYVLLQGLNLNYSNQQDKAIALLQPFITKKHDDTEAQLDIYLALIICHLQNGDIKTGGKLLSRLYHTDKWYIEKAGQEWVLKKNLVDILVQLELGNINLFESRLRSFRRQYSNYLKHIKQERVLTFLKLVESYYHHPEQVTSKTFKNKVEDSFEWIEAKREDIFVMSFYAWLKSKMEQRPLAETTQQLIQLAQRVN